MNILYVLAFIGTVCAIMIAPFLIAYPIYRRMKKKGEISSKKKEDIFQVTFSKMPNLKPIPIPTKAYKKHVRRHAVWLRESRRWQLSDNWTYELEDGTRIILPQGFEFDGASIPRPFWVLLSPIGLLLIPGLIHDYGYKYDQLWQIDANNQVVPYEKDRGKKFWDKLFLDTGNLVNGIRVANWVAWLAVTWFGHSTWKNHREKHCSPNEPKL